MTKLDNSRLSTSQLQVRLLKDREASDIRTLTIALLVGIAVIGGVVALVVIPSL